MAQQYLDALRALLEGVRLPDGVDLVCKHFFGGAAAYADGRICITLTPAGLAMKLPQNDRAALEGEGATPLRYFPQGPVKKQYVVLPQNLRDDPERLEACALKSIAYVLG